MPSFYDKEAFSSFTTTVRKKSFIRACELQSRSAGRTAVQLLLALACVFLSLSCVWRAAAASSLQLLLLLLFVALVSAGLAVTILLVLPKTRRAFFDRCYETNAFLKEPLQVSLYKETVSVSDRFEKNTYYYSKMAMCAETPDAFILIPGREIRFLIFNKQDMGDVEKARDAFLYAFGKRFLKRG